MKFLFFFVHPSKYHLFRITINSLLKKGHIVDITITSKDVLEQLIIEEGWSYKNIFPEGRKISWLPTKIGATINLFRTLVRLWKYIGRKKYDMFITDDLLTIIGRIKRVPTFLFQDDDITAVPESRILLTTAHYVIAPLCTKLKKYNNKKISFSGFKASAYLHPKHFEPDKSIIEKYISSSGRFFILRLVSLAATHDVGKSGLSNDKVMELIGILEKYGNVVISSERQLPKQFEKYSFPILAKDFMHLLAFADLFISDSQTMSSEAGYLGTPFIRFNDFVKKISYLDELEGKYKLGYGIKTNESHKLIDIVKKLVAIKNLKEEWKKKQRYMIENTIDLSEFMLWLFEKYPRSVEVIKNNPDYQLNFR